jgi:capsid protein
MMGAVTDLFTGRARKERRHMMARVENRELRSDVLRAGRRENARRQLEANFSGYLSMGRGSMNTTGSKYPGGLSRTGMARTFDHKLIRRNVRDAMYDSSAARGIATRFADSVADTGLKPRFEPKHEMLGTTPEAAEDWGRRRSAEFSAYLASKGCSLDGINNGYQAMWLYAMEQQRDNDMYIRIHYSKDRGLLNPVQIQFLDADQLLGFCYTSTGGLQAGMSAGIEYDSKGREKSFTFLVYDEEKKAFKDVKIPKYGARSKRTYMIHAFRPEYAGQRQGYSLFTHLLQDFEDTTTLQLSHVQKAINQSSFGFYTKPGKDAPASGGVDDFASEQSEVIHEFLDAADAADLAAGTNVNQLTANILNEFSIRNPGTVWNTSLAGGEDMKAVEQTAPADKFAEFVESLLTNMSASTGMPVEVLLMKFGQNYSASRATLVLFWRIVNMWRSEMERDFLNIWAEAWLSEEIAAGRCSAPGWTDPRMRAAWCNLRWIGTEVPDIDPKKSAEAALLRAAMGHETLEDGAFKYNGSDAATNRAKLAKEIPELVVNPWGVTVSEDEPEDGDEEKEDEDE